MTARHSYVATDLGDLLLVAEGPVLTGVYFEGHWHPPAAGSIGPEVEEAGDPVFEPAAAELREYLAGERELFAGPSRAAGDAFQETVWRRLRDIPYGQTVTYGELAAELGRPALAQRIGQAVGHNPLSIVIPCHRVVGAGGSLTGYAGGLARKAFLLDLETPAEVAAGRLF